MNIINMLGGKYEVEEGSIPNIALVALTSDEAISFNRVRQREKTSHIIIPYRYYFYRRSTRVFLFGRIPLVN